MGCWWRERRLDDDMSEGSDVEDTRLLAFPLTNAPSYYMRRAPRKDFECQVNCLC
jgi:hypothetical protein